MKNVLITGGSGLVGKQLTSLLESKGYTVAWLSRKPQQRTYFLWDVEKQELDPQALEWADAVVHLAGEGVAEKRWTAARKQAILRSRTESTALLHRAIEQATQKPSTFISASAVGFYGFDTLGELIKIKCFTDNPSIKSSLTFLRKTDWARKKVEELYIRTLPKLSN